MYGCGMLIASKCFICHHVPSFVLYGKFLEQRLRRDAKIDGKPRVS